nr:hypothetical protein [uncultured Pseudomonas sp.]
MTWGFRNRQPDNSLTIEITDRLTQQVGVHQVTWSPGAFSVPGEGQVFFMVSAGGWEYRLPEVVLSGRTISWSRFVDGSPANGAFNFQIIYGVF